MKGSMLRQRLKPWMLPIAMACGMLLHSHIHHIAFLTPYLIFLMLLVTFCRIDLKHLKHDAMILMLLAAQIAGSIVAYMLVRPFGQTLAQGAFICVFCPTATAAPVVTGMLGGSVPKLVSFSLVSNIAVALCAPVAFTALGSGDVDIVATTATIAAKVAPLILLPLVVALAMRKITPKLHKNISEHQSVSFYIWAVSLIIVVGNSVSFIMHEPPQALATTLWLAVIAGLACALQFMTGRWIGRRCGDKISGAQGLGQKNTVLAIWMAMTYLDPLSSVAPAAYVAWQNTVNSIQLYFKQRAADNAEPTSRLKR